MFSTTFFTGLSATVLVFSSAAAAVAIHHPAAAAAHNVCNTGPRAAFAPLSKSPDAQEFCASAYGPFKTVTTTTTVTAATAYETVTVTATTSSAASSSSTPVEDCESSSSHATAASATARPSSAAGYYKALSQNDRLYSSLVAAPSAVARAVCSCIETPATVTATATVLPSNGAVKAFSQTPVTVTTTVTYAAATPSTYAHSKNSTSTSTTTSASPATSTYASSSSTAVSPEYEIANGQLFAVTRDSLYAADDSNTIATSSQPDLQNCVMQCATTSGCKYLLWVASTTYEAALQCYLLSNADAGFGTGYAGVVTAEVIANYEA